MTKVSLRVEYNTHKMMADSTARAILDMGEIATKQLLYLLAEGAIAKGTHLEITVVDDDEITSTGAGP